MNKQPVLMVSFIFIGFCISNLAIAGESIPSQFRGEWGDKYCKISGDVQIDEVGAPVIEIDEKFIRVMDMHCGLKGTNKSDAKVFVGKVICESEGESSDSLLKLSLNNGRLAYGISGTPGGFGSGLGDQLQPCNQLSLSDPSPMNAGPEPLLEETELYRKQVSQCKNLDLSKWSHPTKKIFEELDISIVKVQLCNDNKFPIFHLIMPVDPFHHSQDDKTKKYLGKLWKGTMKANGYWPFAIIDLEGLRVINVKPIYLEKEAEYAASTDYEQYRADK